MKKNSKIEGFTLIELIVVIAIIGILFAGSTRINFNQISDKQKLTLFNHQIISQFETVRNNTLLGKGVDVNIGVPDAWKLEYSTTGSGQIEVKYLSGSTWNLFPSNLITTPEFHEISNITCRNSSGVPVGSGNSEIIINGDNLTLTGSLLSSCGSSARILTFDTKFHSFTGSFSINTLNGLIELN